MRIATSTMNKMVSGAMGSSYNDYASVINRIISKKNFTKISENPTDATKVLKLKNQLSELEEYQSNIKTATAEMNLAYDTLGDITDELSIIQDKITEASNGTTTPDEAKAIATEIKQRVSAIQDKMNTKYLDNYIFAGTYTQNQPYVTNDDGDIVYQGSSKKAGDRNLTIAENKTLTYNFAGEGIFGKTDGTNDFFSQMKDLDSLLNAEPLEYDKIREKLGVLDTAVKNTTQTQGDVSAKVSSLETASDSNSDTILKLTEDRSELEDVDIIKAASDLVNAQQALQASYAIGSQVLGSVSLLDYL